MSPCIVTYAVHYPMLVTLMTFLLNGERNGGNVKGFFEFIFIQGLFGRKDLPEDFVRNVGQLVQCNSGVRACMLRLPKDWRELRHLKKKTGWPKHDMKITKTSTTVLYKDWNFKKSMQTMLHICVFHVQTIKGWFHHYIDIVRPRRGFFHCFFR